MEETKYWYKRSNQTIPLKSQTLRAASKEADEMLISEVTETQDTKHTIGRANAKVVDVQGRTMYISMVQWDCSYKNGKVEVYK